MTVTVLFVVVLFVVTWTLGFLLRPSAAPASIWAVLAALLPSVWAPTMLALAFTGWTGGAAGIREELGARFSYRRQSAWWFGLAATVPVAAVALAVFAARRAAEGAPWTPFAALPQMIALQVITGAVGEELGWRGFLLPRLAKRLGEAGAGWVMGVLWSVWHVPAFFTPGLPHPTMPMLSVLLFAAVFAVFLAFVFFRTGTSVLATMLAHLSLNVMTGIGGAQLSSPAYWRTLAGVFGVAAILLTVAPRPVTPAAALRS